MNADSTIKKLLNLRLTKFEYGFCLSLQEHKPTPGQEAILAKILNRYSQMWEKEGNYGQIQNGNAKR
jgi:hypothetical protein